MCLRHVGAKVCCGLFWDPDRCCGFLVSSLDGGTELQAMFIHNDYMTSESIEVADSNYVTSNTVDVVANVTSDENGESGNGENVQVNGFHDLSVESKLCSSVDIHVCGDQVNVGA